MKQFLLYVTPGQADMLLRGRREQRRPHRDQIIVDLLKHLDGKPIEFILAALNDASRKLIALKDENDEEEEPAVRLAQGMRGQFSLSDCIAADLLGPQIAELAGLLPPPKVGDGPLVGPAMGLKSERARSKD